MSDLDDEEIDEWIRNIRDLASVPGPPEFLLPDPEGPEPTFWGPIVEKPLNRVRGLDPDNQIGSDLWWAYRKDRCITQSQLMMLRAELERLEGEFS
jgi:hypothetical protein